jgi:hypothetical protein
VERQKAEGRQRALQSAERRKSHKKIPQGALTREQLKEKRREYCRANQQEINRKQRERRRANAEEVNRKQREYLRRRAEQDPMRRWSKLRQQEQREIKPSQGLHPKGQDTTTLGRPRPSSSADEAVNNWLAYRESQRRAESSHSALQDAPREHPIGEADSRDTEEAGKNSDRGRNNDAAL